MLFDLWQKDALWAIIKKKTHEIVWFTNDWQLVYESDEDWYHYRLRNFDENMDAIFYWPEMKITPAHVKVFKKFFKDEFAYDLSPKKDEEV